MSDENFVQDGEGEGIAVDAAGEAEEWSAEVVSGEDFGDILDEGVVIEATEEAHA